MGQTIGFHFKSFTLCVHFLKRKKVKLVQILPFLSPPPQTCVSYRPSLDQQVSRNINETLLSPRWDPHGAKSAGKQTY